MLTMKFRQLIEYNLRNIFLEKFTKQAGETSHRLFSEISKLSITLVNSLKVLYSLVLFYVQVEGYRNILKPKCENPLLLSHTKPFYKTKRGLKPVSLPHLLHDFSRKIFVTLYSINWPNFIVWLSLILEILGNMCIVIVCFPGFEVTNFENFDLLS